MDLRELALPWHKLRWTVAGEGVLGLARRAATTAWRLAFRDSERLFFIDADRIGDEPPALFPGLSVEPIARRDDLPARHRARLRAFVWKEHMPEHCVERYLARLLGLFDDGGVLWVAALDGELAGYVWTMRHGDRYAPHFPMFPLAEGDALLLAAFTLPEHRGKGLLRLLLRAACHGAKRQGVRRLFTRIKVWNAPSIRATTRAGLEEIARCRRRRLAGGWEITECGPSAGAAGALKGGRGDAQR
jgi:GNAT superfamily N-acetyltransferase